jgi:hypothetical protein
MHAETKARVRPGTPHHSFCLLAGGGPLLSYCANSWLWRFVKNAVHWSLLSGSQTGRRARPPWGPHSNGGGWRRFLPCRAALAGLGSRRRSASTCHALKVRRVPCTLPRTGRVPPTRGGTRGQSRWPCVPRVNTYSREDENITPLMEYSYLIRWKELKKHIQY